MTIEGQSLEIEQMKSTAMSSSIRERNEYLNNDKEENTLLNLFHNVKLLSTNIIYNSLQKIEFSIIKKSRKVVIENKGT